MEELHTWLNAQIEEKTVEPNSSLGQAIDYMLMRWKNLTGFLRIPGAPLDNNICERTESAPTEPDISPVGAASCRDGKK
jgi:hypothetical protein